MLHIFIENSNCSCDSLLSDEYITDISEYFEKHCKKSWFKNESVKSIIKEIDKSDVLDSKTVYNKKLGNYSIKRISDDCKRLLILMFTDEKVYFEHNSKGLLELIKLSKSKDIFISVRCLLQFPDEFDAVIDNTNNVIHSYDDFLTEYIKAQ